MCENEEVTGFHSRIRELVNVDQGQLQNLKISKYLTGQEFTVHTDAVVPHKSQCSKEDTFADVIQQSEGNHHCKAGHNRFLTVFVYLNDCNEGGSTTFPRIGLHYGLDGESFYDKPGPFNTTKDRNGDNYKAKAGTSTIDVAAYCEPPLHIAPRRGLACIHFPSLIPELGGTTDGNVVHQSEPAVDTKFICQQFIYSAADCGRDKNSLPSGRLSDVTL